MIPYTDQNIILELPYKFHKDFIKIANAIVKEYKEEASNNEALSISAGTTLFDSIPSLIEKFEGYKLDNIVLLKSIIICKTESEKYSDYGVYSRHIFLSLYFRVEITLYPYLGSTDMLLTEAELYDVKKGRYDLFREDFRKPVIN